MPLWCVMFPDATLSHAPPHCLFRARRAWGDAPSLSHKPRRVTDLSMEIWERRLPMHLRALCDPYHGRERLKARLRVTDSFALI